MAVELRTDRDPRFEVGERAELVRRAPVEVAVREGVANEFAPKRAQGVAAGAWSAQKGQSEFEIGVEGELRRRLQLRRLAGGAAAQGTPNLQNQGGGVLRSPSLSLIFVGAYWHSARGADERQHIAGFARSYASNPVQGVIAQYGAGPARFDSAQVVNEVAPRFINRGTLREYVMAQARADGPRRDPQRIYSVVLPPGVILGDGTGTTSLDGMAGYHGSFIDAAGRPVYYAAIAYSGSLGRNGINFDGEPRDAITITLSHEWAEAVTDPNVEHGGVAWYDQKLGEIGDLAISQLPLGNTYVYVNGYAQQKLWSNRDQRYEVAPAP